MTDRPRITAAVLIILKEEGSATPARITQVINTDDRFKPLRDCWGGRLKVDQVYAAMSSLRSLSDPKRNFIMPRNGVVGKAMTYQITGYGEKRLRGEPKTYGDIAPALAAHVLKTAAEAAEQVDHPAHYGGADNAYEAIKVIEAWDLGFNLGNTVKYIARSPHKGSTVTDLEKARWYLDREISKMKGIPIDQR